MKSWARAQLLSLRGIRGRRTRGQSPPIYREMDKFQALHTNLILYRYNQLDEVVRAMIRCKAGHAVALHKKSPV